ncbi:hypothetical protein KSP40_PGU015234 [Platanthera guangdongensis]|uniref:Uncharacterized protein n=1 Tax=Platanthera guangdongensis TaxID=2320717 RepID=A0ABR2M3T2_9ASPA
MTFGDRRDENPTRDKGKANLGKEFPDDENFSADSTSHVYFQCSSLPIDFATIVSISFSSFQ